MLFSTAIMLCVFGKGVIENVTSFRRCLDSEEELSFANLFEALISIVSVSSLHSLIFLLAIINLIELTNEMLREKKLLK